MKRWLQVIALFLLLAPVGYMLSPQGRVLVESVALLADVWSIGKQEGSISTGRPAERFEYPGPGGSTRVADLYCSGEELPRGRLILAHGLIETGKNDARLGALGRAFARHGFLVMIPDFPGMRSLRAGRGDIEEVAAVIDAAGGLDFCPAADDMDRAPDARVGTLQTGIIGFSYSAGPVLLALDREDPGADFAVLFGGYYDLTDVLLFLTTGRYYDEETDRDGEILPGGRWLLLAANVDTVADVEDRRTLLELARRKIADPDAPIDDLAGSLGGPSRAVLDLMSNADPDRFVPLLDAAGPKLKALLDDLSPSKSLSGPLPVDLYLLHGRSDVIVPYTQSIRMRQRLLTSGSIRLALLGGFRHARPEGPSAARWWSTALGHPADSVALLGIIGDILERRAPPR